MRLALASILAVVPACMFSDDPLPPPDAASTDPDAGAVVSRPPPVGTITVAAQRYLSVLDNQAWFVVHDQDGRVWSLDTVPPFADRPLELPVPARAMVTFLSRNDWGVPSVTTVTGVEPGDELVLWGLVHPGFTLGTVTLRFPRVDASTRTYSVVISDACSRSVLLPADEPPPEIIETKIVIDAQCGWTANRSDRFLILVRAFDDAGREVAYLRDEQTDLGLVHEMPLPWRPTTVATWEVRGKPGQYQYPDMTVRAWAPDALLTSRYYDSGMLRYPMTLVIEDGASLWWQLDTRNWRGGGYAQQTLVTANPVSAQPDLSWEPATYPDIVVDDAGDGFGIRSEIEYVGAVTTVYAGDHYERSWRIVHPPGAEVRLPELPEGFEVFGLPSPPRGAASTLYLSSEIRTYRELRHGFASPMPSGEYERRTLSIATW